MYRKFKKKINGAKIQKLLLDQNISCEIMQEINGKNYWTLIINDEDYAKVELALFKYDLAEICRLPKDYYLFSFTDFELIDILKNKGDWGEIDYTLALKILEDRGLHYPQEILNNYELNYLSEKRQREKQEEESANNTYFGSSPFSMILQSFVNFDEITKNGKINWQKLILFFLLFLSGIILILTSE